MGRSKSKTSKKPLLYWVITLCAALLILAGIALVPNYLRQLQQPIPTEPAPNAAPVLRPNPYADIRFSRNEQGYLTTTDTEVLAGIDVSSHQGVIDWEQVAASGIQFAMIRLGYRGYETGTIHADEMAQQNLTGARAAGLKIGAYFFSQAVTAEEAAQEAAFALEMLNGIPLDLPLVYDWEYVSDSARTAGVSATTLTMCIRAFFGRVEQVGYAPMLYFNQDLARTRLELTQLANYPFWLAMYSDKLTFPYQVRFWQYSDQGTVPGIEGDVDLDLYFP